VQEVQEVQRVQRACIVLLLALPCLVSAQTAQQQNMEVDPVQCWWRTSTPSVRVGEQFTIHLTCAALETDAATAVIDRSRLGAASVQFPPFEVTGGTQSADYVTASRRFMQYHYNLRLIAEDFFGSDIVIPAMTIAYRIESRVQSDAAVQGREQNYEMPAITMRINALVASDARHIREPAVPGLDEIAAREFRARMFRLVATILFGIAALTLVVALLGWLRAKRKSELSAARHFVPHRTVLAGVRRELRDVQQQTRSGGWSLDAIARALAATRLAASYLSGQTVTQSEVQQTSAGQLGFDRGLLGRRRIGVSAATTGRAVRGHAAAPDLDDALTAMTAARYGRGQTYDGAVLDEALAIALRATDRAAARHTWIAESMRSLSQALRGWTPRAWAR
jgi:hypothetical protein